MKILITGGSGFLGRALTSALLQAAHEVTWLSRTPEKQAKHMRTGLSVQDYDRLDANDAFEVIINLAGAGIADQRWSAARKKVLLESRLKPTEAILAYIQAAEQKPKLLLSSSAIGWYGANSVEPMTEQSSCATMDFAHEICEVWEQKALEAAQYDVEVVRLRTGLVMSPEGGMLSRVLLPFKLGLGGRLGQGSQMLSWISREDWVAAVIFILQQTNRAPIYNLTAPNPISNAEFSETLAKALKRPHFCHAPKKLLQLALGEMSTLLLDGQAVLPAALQQAGFSFAHPEFRGYLQQAVGSAGET